MEKKRIGIFVGSLRKASFSKKVACYVGGLLKGRFAVEMIDLAPLCMFNQDYDDEGATPAAWTAFRQQVKRLDGLLFFTPEYNRSMPALLKNALDIGSRPMGQNVWDGKPAAVVGVSPGKIGGALGVQALRAPLAFLNLRLMQQPEVYLGDAAALFDEQGEPVSEGTAGFLKGFAEAYSAFVG
ncbi:MAG: NAD(P)H-dependent oxidoreductase [Tannerella sp.]|jgi:chromate reductase|nr:NAD(P)H-dependent oxidoreductase [Tannerella sp.]